MNLEHLRTFLWLRWRLHANQLRRSGQLATALVTVLLVVAVTASFLVFVGGILLGFFVVGTLEGVYQLLIWDGLTALFLFGWTIGLLTELQRTETLSLDRFLHLPVSLSSAFLINYVSSFASISMLLFVPSTLGLLLGLLLSDGPAMLLGFPLLAAFLLVVTALTYQFQGWLAGLMANPRRRRTVIVLVTFGFIALTQLPNLLNIVRARSTSSDASTSVATFTEGQKALTSEFLEKKISQEEYERRSAELKNRLEQESEERKLRRRQELEESTRFMNLVLPPAWFPLGMAELAAGRVGPALLAIAVFAGVGALSLWRAYRATLRLYTGSASGSAGASRPAVSPRAARPRTRPRLVEWRIPGLSECTAAVATASFTSLLRAPEAKMLLLTPVIFVFVFGSAALSGQLNPPEPVRPLIAFGGSLFVLVMAMQLLGNQFGYDRSGFRAYVLSPLPRDEILFGKNLAVVPFTFALALLAVVLVEVFYPMRIDRLLAAFVQFVSAYLLFSLVANMLSIFAPIPIAAGSFKPARTQFVPVLLHMLALVVLPTLLLPTFLPLGIELLLELAGLRGLPVSLVLSLALLGGVVWVYRRVLRWQGGLLEAREKQILEVVTSKCE